MNHLKTKIIDKAKSLGFLFIGFSTSERLDQEAVNLKQWLSDGFHGDMNYMENHFEKRINPQELHADTQTIISLAYNYSTKSTQKDQTPKISKYAYGKDYHKVIKKKLNSLIEWLEHEYGDTINAKMCVDSVPIMEREWAKRSGIGWYGKNTLIIHPKFGSYFFLSEILLNVKLEADQPIKNYCGDCTKCIDACPTEALDINGYVLNANKCISYLTIEMKNKEIPLTFKNKMSNYIFGCDICQEVCPWNRFSYPHEELLFNAKEELLKMTKDDWDELSVEKYELLFNGTPLRRAGYQKLKSNIKFLDQE